jgi:hypothetical protein
MDVKTAIDTGDAPALRQLLNENSSLANEPVRWGESGRISTHPLHYGSDRLFGARLEQARQYLWWTR